MADDPRGRDGTHFIDPDNDPAWPVPRTDGTTAADAFRVPFSIGTGLSLGLWSLLALIIVSIIVQSAGGSLTDPVTTRVSVMLGQLLALAGVVALLRSTGRWSWRIAGPVRPRPSDVATGVGVGVAGVGLVFVWAAVYGLLFGDPPPSNQALLDDLRVSGVVVALSYVVAVVLAPIVEETIYRGVLFQASRRQMGLWPGVALNALIFAGVHLELYPPAGTFQPIALFGLAMLGGWFSWSFHRSGSLLVVIVGHATFNAINLTLAIVSS